MSQEHSVDNVPEFDLVDRLHKAMRERGTNATRLASELGVHRNTINNYLSGKPIDRRTIMAWAMACGVSVSWLEHGTVTPPSGGGTNMDMTSRHVRTCVMAARSSHGHLQAVAA